MKPLAHAIGAEFPGIDLESEARPDTGAAPGRVAVDRVVLVVGIVVEGDRPV